MADQPASRFVPKDRHIGPDAICVLCGATGGVRTEQRRCRPTACQLCGTKLCMSHGARDGTCPVCRYGYLRGWTHLGRESCTVDGCGGRAVGALENGERVCREHATDAPVNGRASCMSLIHYLQTVVLPRRTVTWVRVRDLDGEPIERARRA